MTKKPRQKFKYLDNEKKFLLFLNGFHWSKWNKIFLEGESSTLIVVCYWPFKGWQRFIAFQAFLCNQGVKNLRTIFIRNTLIHHLKLFLCMFKLWATNPLSLFFPFLVVLVLWFKVWLKGGSICQMRNFENVQVSFFFSIYFNFHQVLLIRIKGLVDVTFKTVKNAVLRV